MTQTIVTKLQSLIESNDRSHRLSFADDFTRFNDSFGNSMSALTRCLKITEKSLIQHCERSELSLQFNDKMAKKCYQTGQKLVENAKIKNSSETFLGNFQTMCL